MNPILYIGGPGYSYQHFEPLLDTISVHFDEILSSLKIFHPSGEEVKIELFIEGATPEKVRAHAKRIEKSPFVYEIRMTAGLSYHLWLASRALASKADYLPWVNKCKLLDPINKKIGRKELLADYAYFLMSYLVLLHEISHVVLGHCDYIRDEMGFESLDEFQDETRKLTAEEIRIRLAFEAEADRQAGELLVAFFENSLGDRGLGRHIQFPSRVHAYEFYTYSITFLFVLLQQLNQRKGVIHPKPNERQYIIVSSMMKYFEIYKKNESKIICDNSFFTMIRAAKKTGLIEGDDKIKVARNAVQLSFVDDVIREIKIRNFQHKIHKKSMP